MLEMSEKLIWVDPQTLKKNPWNSNHLSPEAEKKLDAAIERFGGFFKPIVVREADGGLEILGGAHRCDSAIRLGYDKVPVFNLGHIDDKTAKEIGLADNSRYGVDDATQLADILRDLDVDDLTHFLPYQTADLKAIFASTSIALDDLDAPDFADDEDALPSSAARPPKTHTIMRFKIPIGDAERIEKLIETAKKHYGLTGSDDLTNAGDALVQLLLGAGETEATHA